MDPIARRAHARVACDRPAELVSGAASGGRVGDGFLIDLSLSGALLAYGGELSRGAPYRLRLQDAEGELEIPFRVARETPRGSRHPDLRHYGLVFNLTSEQERRLRALIDSLRARPRRAPRDGGGSLLARLLRRWWPR